MATENNGDMDNKNSEDMPTGGLEGFVANQIKQQEKESKDNLDVQKRDDFIARALAESKRMNKEIEKSQEKRNNLQAEFGTALMDDWRQEHASQVLTPQQQELVELHHQ